MKSLIAVLVFLAVLAPSLVHAGTRCRSTTMGSTTYITCESPSGKTECRASRSGSTTYTSCR
jgi:hypothetical protein